MTSARSAQIVLGRELTIGPRRRLLQAVQSALHPNELRRIEMIAPARPFPKPMWCLLLDEVSRDPELRGTQFRLRWEEPLLHESWEEPTALPA